MDKADIRACAAGYRAAALRSKKAGFDLVYVYAGHDLTMLMHFLSRRHNHRSDEYGGALENRARLFREVLEDTKEAIGDSCAIAVRFAVDELLGPEGITAEGEGREVVEMLAELPDLWDVNVSGWPNDSMTSRFGPEGGQEAYVAFVKQVTSKPVVGVGRFTSPDAMVSQIKRGVLDLIGAARPSIADPFLPQQDRGGPPGGHPRVHRLQHLRLGRLHHGPDALHPEPDHGRGVAPRLAPREHRAQGLGRPFWWSAPARPGWRRPGRSASAATGDPGRGRRRAGRPGRPGMPPAGPVGLGPGARLPGPAVAEDGQCRDLSGEPADADRRQGVRLSRGCCWRPARAGARTASAAPTAAIPGQRPAPCDHA